MTNTQQKINEVKELGKEMNELFSKLNAKINQYKFLIQDLENSYSEESK
jgi:uncharacterized coiled-coil DUF342 family protein